MPCGTSDRGRFDKQLTRSESQARTLEFLALGTATPDVRGKVSIVSCLSTADPDKQTKPEMFPISFWDKNHSATIIALEYFTVTHSSERE